MYYQNDQVLETMVKGWTRIEMLLSLYERAIDAVENARVAADANDNAQIALSSIEANKFILGLLSGLDSDQCAIAFGVEQILVFVMLKIERREFEEAKRFLTDLHGSFTTIRDEAVALEKEGKIPPLADGNVLDTVA